MFSPGPPPPPPKSNVALIVAVIVGVVLLCGLISAGAGVVVWAINKEREEARRVAAEAAEEAEEAEEKAKEEADKAKQRAEQPRSTATIPQGQVVTGTDSRARLEIPRTWQTLPDLNAEATISVGDRLQGEYLIVLTEAKADFAKDFTLQKYADLTLTAMLQKMSLPTKSGPKPMVINGQQALRYEVDGTVDYMNIAYLITYVEGPKCYHQILAWTLKSRYDAKRDLLARVSGTLQEI